jgi:hypothetical protein
LSIIYSTWNLQPLFDFGGKPWQVNQETAGKKVCFAGGGADPFKNVSRKNAKSPRWLGAFDRAKPSFSGVRGTGRSKVFLAKTQSRQGGFGLLTVPSWVQMVFAKPSKIEGNGPGRGTGGGPRR